MFGLSQVPKFIPTKRIQTRNASSQRVNRAPKQGISGLYQRSAPDFYKRASGSTNTEKLGGNDRSFSTNSCFGHSSEEVLWRSILIRP